MYEDALLDSIKKKILDVNFYRNITVQQIEGIMSAIKEYGDYKYDAGIEWANDQAYYSGDEA